MALLQQGFPQFDISSEFLNAGDLGRLVTSCCHLLDRPLMCSHAYVP